MKETLCFKGIAELKTKDDGKLYQSHFLSLQWSRRTQWEGDTTPLPELGAAQTAEAAQLHMELPVAQRTMAKPASIKPINKTF